MMAGCRSVSSRILSVDRSPFITRLPCLQSLMCMSTSNSSNAPLPKPDVRKVAEMAQLSVTEEEVKDWEPKINEIIDWFGKLQAVDLSSVPPSLRGVDDQLRLGQDNVVEFHERTEMMKLAPDVEDSYIRIPKIATGADDAKPADKRSLSRADMPSIHALDIRVGRILKIEKHPDADSLYIERVDVGEDEPRTIVSGLVQYVPEESLLDSNVIVLCNLKPRNMRGVKSKGMLLCASDAVHENVDVLRPPKDAAVGERIHFGPDIQQSEPELPNKVQKSRIWESLQPALTTGEDGVARFLEDDMNTSKGPVLAETLKNASIS